MNDREPKDRPVALFRVDGGAGIGSGHLMRALALAECLVEMDWHCFLLTRNFINVVEKWRSIGAEVVILDECPETERALVEKAGPDWCVLDGYHFLQSTWDLYRGEAGGRVLVYDDALENDVRADLIVNQNPGAEVRFRYSFVGDDKVLLGCRYVQLRNDIKAHGDGRGQKRGILVSFGGDDRDGLARRTLDLFLEANVPEDLTIIASCPSEELAELQNRSSSFEHINVLGYSDLGALMAHAKVCLVAAGTTALEAMYIGTPAVLVSTADNQVPGATYLDEGGCALYAGTAEVNLDTAVDMILDLLEDQDRYDRIRQCGRALVDGQGVNRVASMMEHILQADNARFNFASQGPEKHQ